MQTLFSQIVRRVLPMGRGQQGITGLETAIVLIAFVVVASVFAFAVLSTGLFSTDKAKEAVTAGLEQTRSSMELRGSVVAKIQGTTPGTSAVIDEISFQVANAAGGEAIDLTQGPTYIKYSDISQTVNMTTVATFTVTNVSTESPADNLLEPGQVYEIKILDVDGQLGTDLGVNKTFVVEVVPRTGAVLHIERTTPSFLEVVNSLD